MRPTIAIPLIMLAGAATATVRIQDLSAGSKTAPEPTRLAASIEDDLSKRQAKLDQRARALDLQERMLAATKARVAPAQVAGPAAARPQTSTASQGPEKPEADEKILQLARVYQAMKPRDAATVFEQLAMPLQVKIASQMRERSVAAMMSAMSPPAASALTSALAGVVPAPAAAPSTPPSGAAPRSPRANSGTPPKTG